MTQDGEGFAVPSVNETCDKCGVCVTRCPATGKEHARPLREGYMAVYLDRSKGVRSSSGGVFYALAKWVLQEKGGVVVGARLMPDGSVKHDLVERVDDIQVLQGSKYVQSETASVLPKCKKAVASGRTVLFCGTPCQVAAAKAYVGNAVSLITVELICHGVPSPGLWRERVDELFETGVIGKRDDILFRVSNRSNRTLYCIATGSGKTLLRTWQDWFYSLFVDNASLRECCYACPHASEFREGDLVIGDCAVSSEDYEFHPDLSVSSVFPVSDKGRTLFEDVLSWQCDIKELDVQKERAMNKQLSQPSKRPEKRNDVFSDFNSMSRTDFKRKYIARPGIGYFCKELVKELVSVKKRARLKRLLGGLR